jgi:hypothetical protein
MKHLFKLLCLLIITNYPSHAMEKQNSLINFIAMLPREIQDLIAEYLQFNDRETDAEFIARTEKLVPDPNKIEFNGEEKKLCSYSPHKAYSIAAYDIDSCAESEGTDHEFFTTIKISHKFKQLHTIFQEPRPKGTTCAVAIANDGNMYAYVRRLMDHSGFITEGLRYKYLVTIKNPLINYVKELHITGRLSGVAVCDFNKQITKFIVHDHKGWDGKNRHKIYSLSSDNVAKHDEKIEKTLQDYFKQKGICKNLFASKLIEN